MYNRFYFSRSYSFKATTGERRNYFFILTERTSKKATFLLVDKGNTKTVSADIVMDGDTETATFVWNDVNCSLRADNYISKNYPVRTSTLDKKKDLIKNAYLHTIYNRHEVEQSKSCCCISCQTIFHPSEVKDYTDDGQTAICPYCGTEAIIGDASGINMSANKLTDLHMCYFNLTDNPLIELTIDQLSMQRTTPTTCKPYVWFAKIEECDGYAISTGFCKYKEGPEYLRKFYKALPRVLISSVFEVIDCRLHDIKDNEALNAINLGIAKFLCGKEAKTLNLSQFKIKRDVNFAITKVGNSKTIYFTLHKNGSIELPKAIRNMLPE